MILSRTARIVIMGELTAVPWEDDVEEVHERKKEKYEELVMQCEELAWKAHCHPFEVGSRGFVAVNNVFSLLLGCCWKREEDSV